MTITAIHLGNLWSFDGSLSAFNTESITQATLNALQIMLSQKQRFAHL